MSYELDRAGWASFGLRCGEAEFKIPAFAYVTDGLGDIIRAALSIVTGTTHVDVLFDCEPHIWGLSVEPAGVAGDHDDPIRLCRVTVRDGGDGEDGAANEGGPVWLWNSAVLLEAVVVSDDFGHAALRIAEVMRERTDDKSYRERWGHYANLEGFPLRGMTALSAALSVKEYRG